jgi:hypothetical protein
MWQTTRYLSAPTYLVCACRLAEAAAATATATAKPPVAAKKIASRSVPWKVQVARKAKQRKRDELIEQQRQEQVRPL